MQVVADQAETRLALAKNKPHFRQIDLVKGAEQARSEIVQTDSDPPTVLYPRPGMPDVVVVVGRQSEPADHGLA